MAAATEARFRERLRITHWQVPAPKALFFLRRGEFSPHPFSERTVSLASAGESTGRKLASCRGAGPPLVSELGESGHVSSPVSRTRSRASDDRRMACAGRLSMAQPSLVRLAANGGEVVSVVRRKRWGLLPTTSAAW